MRKNVLLQWQIQYVIVLALISKTIFLGLIHQKKSVFPVKFFVVRSVKQGHVITKDGIFLEKFKWNVEKYATPGGCLQYDPGHWG